MAFLDKFRAHRADLTIKESVDALNGMDKFMEGGKNWTQNQYISPEGKGCLVGAHETVKTRVPDGAREFLQQAILEREPWRKGHENIIEGFNDSHKFPEVQEVMTRAQQLALERAHALNVPAPKMPALPAPQKTFHGDILSPEQKIPENIWKR